MSMLCVMREDSGETLRRALAARLFDRYAKISYGSKAFKDKSEKYYVSPCFPKMMEFVKKSKPL